MSDAAAPPAVPRPAASLLVVRAGGGGPEVLMGLRGAGHKFMPNRLVFPGGAVDPDDHAAPVASPLPGWVRRRLEVSADPALAAALGVAAARELLEETGLTLGAPPHLGGLDYLSRAVTPAASPIRFDARFFVVDAAEVAGELAGSGELEDLRWFGVAEALGLDLATATRGVLGKLVEWMAMSPDQRAARPTTPVMFSRAWQEE
jgi:8-oxo-dGTP pyrophosphatase MutT (NUDIX family)